ncbi:hypothetical protein BJ322DRAFT_1219219 [Thelephora terrestris]|uniref:NACHT domain-containing protein n=1 Tax=Thelephora terrestris TaxID=56493 RepID=A0A9P6HDB5_9AGAM|nr:hypothetical protein BJ322DRAFT_1219219 [Thelephora terrestris]
MSKVLKKLLPSASGRDTGSSSAKNRRLIDATKMLLDIAKESADCFPPLKSCLGGINALIKHYEESEDVQDKLGDFTQWLSKLKVIVATVSNGGNREEAQRREEFIRSLQDIDRQSRALLGKGKTARILDKTQDSGTVVKLIEQLQQAILVYQLTQQQSIDDHVSKLAVSFNEYLKLRETAPGIKVKIESILARMGGLNLGNTEDEDESKRRTVLLEALEGIENKLHSISERSNAVGYRKNDADVQVVCELAEHVRDAVVEYQLSQQQAIYEQNCKMIVIDERTALNTCRRAHGAGYQHGNRNGCLKGTRGGVLDKIELWAGDFATSPVFWLNGLAGTGKSTIAQTIAERTFADDRLGASFFCSRGVEDRSDLHLIFPTLAFQLAQRYPEFRSSLIPLLQSNPDIAHESLLSQMQKLIVDPILSAKVSTVIVIDALDECKDEEPESAILLVLGQLVSKIPNVKFFITSRPERHIMSGFRGPLLKEATNIFILHQVDRSTVDNDIRRFFKHELSKLACRLSDSEGWPTDEQVESLCRRAAGFFVYAVATVKFLNHKFRLPSDRLEVIQESPQYTVHEGQTGLKTYNSLDSLYASILKAAFFENTADDDALVRSVLSAVVLVINPLSPPAIANLMGLECNMVTSILESVQSMLVLHEDTNQPTQPFHKSFPDFMTDPSRCSDPRFHISPDFHTNLILRCLGLMYGSLKKNMFGIPDYALNSDVEGLPGVGKPGIDNALVYACRSWYKHLVVGGHPVLDVLLSALRCFLEENFLFWLEVLSVLGAVGDAARALSATLKWLNEIKASIDLCTLIETATDCLRFVTEFFEVISQSAPHIYHSALSLAPVSSIVRRLYSQHISSVAQIITGIPTSQDSCTAIASSKSHITHAMWSPCGQYIATVSPTDVEVRNSTTLEISYTLKIPGFPNFHLSSVMFSPDGHLLICDYLYDYLYLRKARLKGMKTCKLIALDIQTGVVIKELDTESMSPSIGIKDYPLRGMSELAGRVHNFLRDGSSNVEVLCKDQQMPKDAEVGGHWIHEGSLRFATSLETGDGLEISIREFKPTSTPPHPVVMLFHVPYYDGEFSFSPVSTHASFDTGWEVIVLDVTNSKTLLHTKTTQRSNICSSALFSPDGCFFACQIGRHGISIWKNTPTGYIPWSTVQPRSPGIGFSFSPNTASILVWSESKIQLLCPNNHISPSTPNPVKPDLQHNNHLVIRSMDGTWIATARRGDCIITILDPLSGTSQYSINAKSRIQDMRFVHNTILVLGDHRLARWNLETNSAKEVEVDCGILNGIDPEENLTLSNDGAWVICFRDKLLMINVKSQEIMSSYRIPRAFYGVSGFQISPCGSKLSLWSRIPFISDTYGNFSQVEIKEGHFASDTRHDLEHRWSLFTLIPSQDGFHIGHGGRWVEDSGGRKVFWLSPSWMVSDARGVIWTGNLLALVDSCHKEPIIIQF